MTEAATGNTSAILGTILAYVNLHSLDNGTLGILFPALPAWHTKAEIRNLKNQEEENGKKIMVVYFYDARNEQLFDYGARRHDCHVSAGYAG